MRTFIFSDSSYVVGVFIRLLDGEDVQFQAHVEWWEIIQRSIKARGGRQFFGIQWAPSHQGNEAIDAGRITPIQAHLNAGADRLALAAARA
eukprot:2555042-Lingulodinium_polyedra.AAC.1